MDDSRSILSDYGVEHEFPDVDEPAMEAPPQIGNDERRMHVRAYNYWVSLLQGRPYPSIEDLDPSSIEDFGPNSVLLDFTMGPSNAQFAYLGAALREEGEITSGIRSIADVPSRSVLSRLTEHYLEIIANRAPIGFEAEYVNQRNLATMYRGILMPFTSDGETIDFIYGVINWKEVVEVEIENDIREAVTAALAEPVASPPAVAVWADGPNVQPLSMEDVADFAGYHLGADAVLYDRLAIAREAVEALTAADHRSHAALYVALGQAYDFALAAETDIDTYTEILVDAGLKSQARAPMTPVVKLIFGSCYDKTRLAEYAAVLNFARRQNLPEGTLPHYLDHHPGGLKAVVHAERVLRRPDAKPDRVQAARNILATAPSLATLALDGVSDEFVSLIGRREADGSVAILSIAAAKDGQLVRVTKALQS